MAKDTNSNEIKALETQVLKNLDDESIEVIKVIGRKEDDVSGDQEEGLRIWHCNGLPVGVHLRRKKS